MCPSFSDSFGRRFVFGLFEHRRERDDICANGECANPVGRLSLHVSMVPIVVRDGNEMATRWQAADGECRVFLNKWNVYTIHRTSDIRVVVTKSIVRILGRTNIYISICSSCSPLPHSLTLSLSLPFSLSFYICQIQLFSYSSLPSLRLFLLPSFVSE